MIRLHRSAHKDPIDDLQEEPLRAKLWEDAHGKCWLCERHVERGTFQVDHFAPRSTKSGAKRVYDWKNLLVACGSCNNRRRKKPLPMIDPATDDPNQRLAQRWVMGEARAHFAPSAPSDEKAKNTADELDHIHNERKVAAEDLRKAILWHLSEIWRTERDLLSSTPAQHLELEHKLRVLLSVDSPFTALARSTVLGAHRRFFESTP